SGKFFLDFGGARRVTKHLRENDVERDALIQNFTQSRKTRNYDRRIPRAYSTLKNCLLENNHVPLVKNRASRLVTRRPELLRRQLWFRRSSAGSSGRCD